MDWSERLTRLTDAQRAALARRLTALGVATGGGQPRLVAYLTTAAARPSDDDLRAYLRERLPDHMIPATFVMLDELPRTPNGKVDRHALPAPEPAAVPMATGPTAPSGAIEAVLAEIWSAVLGITPIGVDDNFFEIGGDSIMSIQIVARARRAGLTLRTGDLFDYPTIASLARELTAVQPAAPVADAEAAGRAPLTPIQHWFFAQPLVRPAHWNQALLLRAGAPLDAGLLGAAVAQLRHHHPVLGTRFVPADDGWYQEAAPPPDSPPVEDHDLRDQPAATQGAAIDALAATLHGSLSLTDGPLFRAARLRLGDGHDRLLLLAHHLVVDAVSWPLLIDDLSTAYRQLERQQPVSLPPVTTSYGAWSRRLADLGRALEGSPTAAYWTDQRFSWPHQIPCDLMAEPAANVVRTARAVVVELSDAETAALLYDLPAVYHTQINEVLLTALGQTLAPWIGAPSVLVAIEGHGREAIDETVDLSRTVGWFTSVFPVLLPVADHSDLVRTLLAVKEELRAVPDRGLSHGLLRYRPGYRERFNRLTEPTILFNYLGRIDPAAGDDLFTVEADSVGPARHLDDPRRYLIEINCLVEAGHFRAIWGYSAAFHAESTIAQLASAFTERLRGLIELSRAEAAGGHSPSDFPLAELDGATFGQVASLLAKLDEA